MTATTWALTIFRLEIGQLNSNRTFKYDQEMAKYQLLCKRAFKYILDKAQWEREGERDERSISGLGWDGIGFTVGMVSPPLIRIVH